MSKANCAVVTYTAIFGSEKAPEESEAPGGNEQHDPAPGQTEAPGSLGLVTASVWVWMSTPTSSFRVMSSR